MNDENLVPQNERTMAKEPYKNLSLEDIEGELWDSIASFEGHYEVSNFGRVKSLARKVWSLKQQCYYPVKERILRQSGNRERVKVRLRSRELEIDKTARPAILVANAFLGKKENQFVFHKDLDVTNNHVSNLKLGGMDEFAEMNKRIKDKHGFTKKTKGIFTPCFSKGVHKQEYYVMSISSKEKNFKKSEFFTTEEEAARRYDYYIDKFNLKREKNYNG